MFMFNNYYVFEFYCVCIPVLYIVLATSTLIFRYGQGRSRAIIITTQI